MLILNIQKSNEFRFGKKFYDHVRGRILPTFNFKNKNTQEEIELFLSLSEREEFLASGEWEQIISVAPAIGDPVHLGVKRTDNAFNDA